MIAVSDGVLVYASDPTADEGELVHDFVAGQTRLTLAGVRSATFVLTPNGTLATVTDPGTITSELAFDFVEGRPQLVIAADQSTHTRVNAGLASSAGTAHGPMVGVSVNATASDALGTGVAETAGTGRTLIEAASTGTAPDPQPTLTLHATSNGTGTADQPGMSLAVNADTALSASDMGFTSASNVVADPNARTISIRDHGHTVSVKLRK